MPQEDRRRAEQRKEAGRAADEQHNQEHKEEAKRGGYVALHDAMNDLEHKRPKMHDAPYINAAAGVVKDSDKIYAFMNDENRKFKGVALHLGKPQQDGEKATGVVIRAGWSKRFKPKTHRNPVPTPDGVAGAPVPVANRMEKGPIPIAPGAQVGIPVPRPENVLHGRVSYPANPTGPTHARSLVAAPAA